MKTILLPVKDFREAKKRLAPALNEHQRAGLAKAMLADVFRALAKARLPERIVIFTASFEAAQIARLFEFEVVAEEVVRGHSAAVNQMVAELADCSSRILAIAADLPKLAAADIDFILGTQLEPITLIPSMDGTGTNGVVFTPPARIAMEYGEGSLNRHLSKAVAAGFSANVLNIPGVAFDLDTPEDLTVFLTDPSIDSETWRFLKASL